MSALYNYTKLSDSDEENNALKKIIANVQFGLLERSYNKPSKSFVSDTIEECNHYRIKKWWKN